MALPDERYETFIDGTSTIDEDFLNENVQDWIVNGWSAQMKRGFVMADDFLGSAFSNLWTTSGSPTCGVDESANDGFGAASLVELAGTSTIYIRGTRLLPICSPWLHDWRFYARVRVDSWNGGEVQVGLVPSSANRWMGFKATTAGTTWRVSGDWNAGETSNSGETAGIVSATYVDLEMRFDVATSTLRYYINGSEVDNEAPTFGAATYSLHFYGTCSAAMAIYCDKIALWVDR